MNSAPHALVVNDDGEIRNLISQFLRKNGFRVDVAADGQEMRKTIANCKIDLVNLDRMLPNEEGISLSRSLRKESRVPAHHSY